MTVRVGAGPGPHGGVVGPGRLTRALGLSRREDRLPLWGPALRLERGDPVRTQEVRRGPRIGVDYAGLWAAKPYRLWLAGNRFVSGGA